MSDKNEQLFIEAVKARRQAMWRVAYNLLHSDADAEDAVSSAVESVWKHLPRIHTKEALPAYLMRSVINAAHDELRKRRHTTPIEPLENVLEAPMAERGIADYLTALDEKYRLSDWEEFIFPCTPDEAKEGTLRAVTQLSEETDAIEGNWLVKIPLRMIRFDNTDQ